MNEKTLKKLGEKVLFQFVYRPAKGHIVDYKVIQNELVIIIEKSNGALVEGTYKEPWNGARNPKKEERKPKPSPPPEPKVVDLRCPRCFSNTYPYDNTGKRICLHCQGKVANNDHIFRPEDI